MFKIVIVLQLKFPSIKSLSIIFVIFAQKIQR